MNDKKQRICDYDDGDKRFLEAYLAAVANLSGCIIEGFDQNPAILLSPCMRRLLSDAAKKVREMHFQVTHRLAIDNPGESLGKHLEDK